MLSDTILDLSKIPLVNIPPKPRYHGRDKQKPHNLKSTLPEPKPIKTHNDRQNFSIAKQEHVGCEKVFLHTRVVSPRESQESLNSVDCPEYPAHTERCLESFNDLDLNRYLFRCSSAICFPVDSGGWGK